MEFKKLLIVIPTRNRADFAINAIDSVLTQSNCNFEVIVSDNSTEEREVSLLFNYCQKIKNERLRYIRPPKPLPMTEHWNWVMEQSIQLSEFSHATYLTDRMVFIKDSLANLQNIIAKYETKIVAYNHDVIDDSNYPIYLRQNFWTGKIFNISSWEILQLYADLNFIQPIPRMSNCFVPRNIFCKLYGRDKYYFSSVSPDFNFAYRCLEIVDSVLYYDKSLMVNYGEKRSNGVNLLSGKFQKDANDFINNLSTTSVCFNTPINDIRILPNAIMHEYCYVQQANNSDKLPQINYKNYFVTLIGCVFSYQEPKMKQEMLKKLRLELGWKLYIYQLQVILERKLKGLQIRINNLTNPLSPYFLRSEFKSTEEAIDYAINHPRVPAKDFSFLRNRLGVKSIKEVKI